MLPDQRVTRNRKQESSPFGKYLFEFSVSHSFIECGANDFWGLCVFDSRLISPLPVRYCSLPLKSIVRDEKPGLCTAVWPDHHYTLANDQSPNIHRHKVRALACITKCWQQVYWMERTEQTLKMAEWMEILAIITMDIMDEPRSINWLSGTWISHSTVLV